MANSVQSVHYGNLQSYKFFMRPTAHRVYGGSTQTKTKHQENVQKLLQILFLHGTCSTWNIAKIKFHSDVSAIRTKEKEYRRLLVGRTDRGKHSEGVLELGLVVKDYKNIKKINSDHYRLSLHGILYCLDVLKLNDHDIDKMTSKYSQVLPKIFGKWDFLKSIIGDDVYKLRILSKGLLLDNQMLQSSINPIYELMSFIHIKYKRNYEEITEEELAEQISYWFYTFLLFDGTKSNLKKKQNGIKKLQKILKNDSEIKKWYLEFFSEAKNYYEQRFMIINNSGIF